MQDTKTPYQYRFGNRVKRLREGKTRGISAGSLRKLIIEGTVSELELIIMEQLYELEYLTSNLLLQCFSHSSIPPEYHMFSSSSGKNPYRKTLANMEHMGIIIVSCFCNEYDEQIGPRIYELSPGAREWMKIRNSNHMSYFIQGIILDDKKGKCDINASSTYEDIIGKLTRNQFHIKAILQRRLDFSAYTPRRFRLGCLEAGYYSTLSNINLILLPVRNSKNSIDHLLVAINDLCEMYYYGDKIEQMCLIIIAEQMEHVKNIQRRLYESVIRKIQILYTTDSYVYYETSLFDHFIRFNGNNIDNYETVSASLQ